VNKNKEKLSPEHTDHAHFDSWGKACVDFNEKLLLQGPRRRLDDFYRLLHIFRDFMKGFHAFRLLGPCVTFFGSARFHENHMYYSLARKTAGLMVRSGFSVMTGGGPGIMEAANRGAKDMGGNSIGCNITLPFEQKPNDYLDLFVEFDHFYVRKVMLLRYSYAFIVLPGGFGTLDEVFETITLIQTQKISNFPVIMMGVDFWRPLKFFIYERLLKNYTIGEKDCELLYFTDTSEDALDHIGRYTKKWTKTY
jgi:uncharacterized protein (TIGR00730 family)